MRVELHDYFRTQLLEELPSSLEMIDHRAIKKMWDEHTARKVNRYKELWSLFMMIKWARNVYESPAQESPPDAQRAKHPAILSPSPAGSFLVAAVGKDRKAA